MKRPRPFTSWLSPHLEGFVALRQASGAVYKTERRWLLAFDRYIASEAPQPPFLRETLWSYLASIEHLSASSRDHIVGLAWSSLAYAKSHGAQVEALPERPPKLAQIWLQRRPRILTEAEISSLRAAARRSPRAGRPRPATIPTLLGLLATTGVRIGEALALDVGDLDRRDRILTIREGKFGKTRALPLRESTTQALVSYIDHGPPSRQAAMSAPLFISSSRRRLRYGIAWEAFREACLTARLSEPWPRFHDFRHTFAIRRVAAWYEQGRDVDALLPALSTYLGHVSVENTRLYLVANGILLEHAAHRFECHTRALDEVLP